MPDYLADGTWWTCWATGGAIVEQVWWMDSKSEAPAAVANSPLVEAEGVHFTVETLRYERHGRAREASRYLARGPFRRGDSVAMYCVQRRISAPSDGRCQSSWLAPEPVWRRFGPSSSISPGAPERTGWSLDTSTNKPTFCIARDGRLETDGTLPSCRAWSRDKPKRCSGTSCGNGRKSGPGLQAGHTFTCAAQERHGPGWET